MVFRVYIIIKRGLRTISSFALDGIQSPCFHQLAFNEQGFPARFLMVDPIGRRAGAVLIRFYMHSGAFPDLLSTAIAADLICAQLKPQSPGIARIQDPIVQHGIKHSLYSGESIQHQIFPLGIPKA
jgi:hypothetical protein